MRNTVNRTFKILGRVYDSFMPSEDMARRIGAEFVDRYGFKSDKKSN